MAKATKKAPAKKVSKVKAKAAPEKKTKKDKTKNSGAKVDGAFDQPRKELPKVTEVGVVAAKNGYVVQVTAGFGPKELFIADDFEAMTKRLKKLFKGSAA